MSIQPQKLLSVSATSKEAARELCFFGVSSFCGECEESSLAIGKLYDFGTLADGELPAPTIIFFSDPVRLVYALPQIEKSSAVGIVLSARALPERTVEALMAFELPFLVIEHRERLPEHCFGCIAILDAKQGSLTVNPNIHTIKKYSLSSRVKESDASMLFRKSDGIRISRSTHGNILIDVQHRRSGELFPLLQSLAEANIDRPITVSLELPHGNLWEERLCEDIEAVFLAALYGNISVIFGGYHTDREINRALTLLKHSFCRLVENRREFNGCLKKGLMISAPLWLTQGLPIANPDTVFLELDTLARRALGCESEISPEHLAFLKSPLMSFAKRHQNIPLSATLSASADASLKSAARELCESADIRESYF